MAYRSKERGQGRVRFPHAKLFLARLAIFWERAWRAFYPAMAVVLLFLALALLDLLPALPAWLHAAVLGLLALGFIVAVRRGLRLLRWPGRRLGVRRLERRSGLDHRPLSSWQEEQATGLGDRDSIALWQAHRERLARQLRRLRIGWPHAGLARRDPYATRAALGLLVIVGLVAAGDGWRERLEDALRPHVTAMAAAPQAQLDVWVNPPAYTGLPPRLLTEPAGAEATQGDEAREGEGAQAGADQAITVPAGSILLAQFNGPGDAPVLRIGEEQEQPFQALSELSYKAETTLTESGRVIIAHEGDELARFPFDVRPDAPPAVEFLSAPQRTQRATLRLDYLAEDDYGVETVKAEITRVDKPEAEPLVLDLPLTGVGLKTNEQESYHDLTPHPWAGLQVDIVLKATDSQGQTGASDAVRTVIPERIFNHPVARALVALRKQLTLDPENRFPVVRTLADLYEKPYHYYDDIVVALALRIAERRLIYERSPEVVPEVQELLWDTALRIEEGELSLAERDMREVYEKLMDAIAKGAPDEEIMALLDELQKSMDAFLDTMAEQMMEQMARGELEPIDPDQLGQSMRREDLRDLLDTARELAESGALDAARDLLAELRNMLENMRAQPLASEMSEERRRAFEMMNEMEELMRRQEELLDRSFDRAMRERQQGTTPQPGQPGGNEQDAREQRALREDLGQLMENLRRGLQNNKPPQALGNAQGDMRRAEDALEDQAPGRAVQPQTRALDQLQQGADAMIEQFMEQLGEGQGGQSGVYGFRRGQNRDPFGRSPAGQGTDGLEGVEIPSQAERRRVQDIQRELRRRAGERQRPRLELDYIERLLRRF